jgi:hypothetical protein
VPPLRSEAVVSVTEIRFPRRIASRERIRAKLDRSGKPIEISVLQRLVVMGKGDYTFTVTAPIVDVRRAPGSQSDPGLRRDQILWQGFSAGNRVLAATAQLRPATASLLPLRISVRTTEDANGRRFHVVLTNATAVKTSAFSTRVDRSELLRALDSIRAAVRLGLPAPEIVMTARGPLRRRTLTVAAPLKVSGRIEVPDGNTVTFSRVLRAPGPLEVEISTRGPAGDAVPRITATATPLVPLDELRAGGGDLLASATRANLAYGRSRQYATFLANPDSEGRASATYVFSTGKAQQAAAAPAGAGEDDGGSAVWPVVVAATLAAAAAAGLVVLWAHL